MNWPLKKETDAVIAALRESPEVIGFMAKREQRILVERKKAAARLAELAKTGPAKYDAACAEVDAAKKVYETAHAAYLASGNALNRSVAKRTGLCAEHTREVNEAETVLLQSASPLIDAFVSEMRDAQDKTRRQPNPETMELQRNPNTGKQIAVAIKARVVRVQDRLKAIQVAIDAALAMRLDADQSGVASMLDELRAALPKIGTFHD